MPMTRGFPETLTEQSLFDKITAHLFEQRRRSMAHHGRDMCAYRDGDGERCCAVGVVIPDDRYSTVLEGKSPTNSAFSKRLPELKPFETLLLALQGVHDSCDLHGDGTFVLDDLRKRLRGIADHYRVNPASIPA